MISNRSDLQWGPGPLCWLLACMLFMESCGLSCISLPAASALFPEEFQTCSSLMCYTVPLVVLWQGEENHLTMLFILLLGRGQEADEIVCFPNAVFFCYYLVL